MAVQRPTSYRPQGRTTFLTASLQRARQWCAVAPSVRRALISDAVLAVTPASATAGTCSGPCAGRKRAQLLCDVVDAVGRVQRARSEEREESGRHLCLARLLSLLFFSAGKLVSCVRLSVSAGRPAPSSKRASGSATWPVMDAVLTDDDGGEGQPSWAQ